MSASLVGSEMCIRDSYSGDRSTQFSRTPPSVDMVSRDGWVLLCSDATCPVSYTHLTLPTICSV
eukprot:10912011-Alexandrium_andersonii.AAC.1